MVVSSDKYTFLFKETYEFWGMGKNGPFPTCGVHMTMYLNEVGDRAPG